jgi:hypothetical protein
MKINTKNTVLSLVLLLTSMGSWAQLSGDLVESSRLVTDSISYDMDGTKNGILVFDIVVDRDGKVVECVWNRVESTVNSRVSSYEAKNRILMGLRFSKDNTYPPTQTGTVTINVTIRE